MICISHKESCMYGEGGITGKKKSSTCMGGAGKDGEVEAARGQRAGDGGGPPRGDGGGGLKGRGRPMAMRSGRRGGPCVGAAPAGDDARGRRVGAAGEGVASWRRPAPTRRGGCEDDEACGSAGQDDDATRGSSRGDGRPGTLARPGTAACGSDGRPGTLARPGTAAAAQAGERGSRGARGRDVDLKLESSGREGRGFGGDGVKVSAGWPYQPALTCPP